MECVIHSYMIYRMLDFVFDISAVRNLGGMLGRTAENQAELMQFNPPVDWSTLSHDRRNALKPPQNSIDLILKFTRAIGLKKKKNESPHERMNAKSRLRVKFCANRWRFERRYTIFSFFFFSLLSISDNQRDLE